MTDPNDMDDKALAAEIIRLETRLHRDRQDYPMNWRFIGSADKERLATCKALRSSRKGK